MHCDSPRIDRRAGVTLGALFTAVSLLSALPAADVHAQAPSVSPNSTQATPMSGQKVYNEVCVACHSPPGVGGAPAFGNREAWAPRLLQGRDTLIEHSLNGFSSQTGIMPKKGGRLDLSDEEIVGALDYILEQVTPDN